ncbi:transcription termination factor NusB [Neorhizobium sp. 2083]|uniref:hypothetical protein n=1 Tax=Neorhizobium sp. 2083 TaxID=2817762 RepID=UPI00286073ED|nr:hypothetical protein [Neorhizobium sp. 2083]MDR6819584.1 transcription termination factor NusB [Neorhizobium sp. 2083]
MEVDVERGVGGRLSAYVSKIDDLPVKGGVLQDDIEVQFDELISEYLRGIADRFPQNVYRDAIKDADLIREQVSSISSPAITRMLFVHYWSIFETYLGDRLVKIVKEHHEALQSLVKSHTVWKAKTLTFEEFYEGSQVILDAVMKELVGNMLYHRFEAVDGLYKATVGTSIFASKDDQKILNKMRDARHHCVHRSGKDKDGNLLKITDTTLDDLRGAIQRSHTQIEEAYRERLEEWDNVPW